jgi:sigma-B regulation protein RsbU (phosphoserine phosphatase)
VPLALGIDNDTVYLTETSRIAPGDALVLYTDGLSDIHSETEHPFFEMVKKCCALKGNAFLDGLLAEANLFNGPEGFFDDVCIVIVELERLLPKATYPA